MLQLKDLLRRKGMTAKELAVKIGISEGALSKSLSGNPTLERIEQIADQNNANRTNANEQRQQFGFHSLAEHDKGRQGQGSNSHHKG